MNRILCSASLLDLPLGRLEEGLQALETGGIDAIHVDLMDGQFAPDIAGSLELVKLVKQCTRLACHAHLMMVQPERHVSRAAEAGADVISVHVEACTHGHRVLSQIREAGVSPGIAINPATPLIHLEYLLPLVDRVSVLVSDPGLEGRGFISSSFDRVKLLRENIRYHGYKALIEVEGLITIPNAARLHRFGAESIVLGTPNFWKGPAPAYGEALEHFRQGVEVEKHLV